MARQQKIDPPTQVSNSATFELGASILIMVAGSLVKYFEANVPLTVMLLGGGVGLTLFLHGFVNKFQWAHGLIKYFGNAVSLIWGAILALVVVATNPAMFIHGSETLPQAAITAGPQAEKVGGTGTTKPNKMYTLEDRRRILEALYKVNEINSREFGKIIDDTRAIYLDWFNRDNSLSATRAAETIKLIEENDRRIEAARGKLYRELPAEYEIYWDVISATVDEEWKTGHPLDVLQTLLQGMISELRNFIGIIEKHSITNPSPELTYVTWRVSSDINAQVSFFEDWRLRNSRRIKQTTDKFRDAQ